MRENSGLGKRNKHKGLQAQGAQPCYEKMVDTNGRRKGSIIIIRLAFSNCSVIGVLAGL